MLVSKHMRPPTEVLLHAPHIQSVFGLPVAGTVTCISMAPTAILLHAHFLYKAFLLPVAGTLSCISMALAQSDTDQQTSALELLATILATKMTLPAVKAQFCDDELPTATLQLSSEAGQELGSAVKAAMEMWSQHRVTGVVLHLPGKP